MKPLLFIACLLFVMIGCNEDREIGTIKDSANIQLFDLLTPAETGIDFNNVIVENERFNYLNYDVVYNGGGVAVGDINNDGLVDIYFSGNQVSDRLYLNKGNLKFEDITQSAGIDKSINWSSAVTMGDVNNDGFLDIYVCKYLLDDPIERKNQLFINNGNLTFTEKGEEMGVADSGYSTSASFLDFNKDGLLDLYVGNQMPSARIAKRELGSSTDKRFTDRLFKNEGNGRFSDITSSAGITNYAPALSVTCADINNDGYTDIYVANDYEEPDFLYINNQNETFSYKSHEMLKHMSNFSMGADIADFNNDGYLDIFTADMVAEDNYRLKTNMSGMNPDKFWGLVKAGYHHQYMFNALQLNNGNGTFSEIGQLAGVSSTDWSWTALFADLDLDGYKDLIVTNGLLRDVRNNDYNNWAREQTKEHNEVVAKQGDDSIFTNVLRIAKATPTKKLANYMFRNNRDLTFQNIGAQWGFSEPAWSQGAAYADLDNDGDLDLLVNNMNDPAFLFKNNAIENNLYHYIKIYVGDKGKCTNSHGARVRIRHGTQSQMIELTGSRGFLSCSEQVALFGLGADEKVDEVEVRWQDGNQVVMHNLKANKTYYISKDKAEKVQNAPDDQTGAKPIFAENQGGYFAHVGHMDPPFDDYAREILLPYKMSQLGPCVAVGDFDQNGYDDMYIGGAKGVASAIQLQFENGDNKQVQAPVFIQDAASEDLGAAIFDIDNDGDLDLYVVSGGNEYEAGSSNYDDRIYLNEGGGMQWKRVPSPVKGVSGGKCTPADYDGDGDMDLFVSGRQVPGHYGFPVESFILENVDGKLVKYTKAGAEALQDLGMVTDAAWSDLDGDKDLDLIVVGEWMPISVFLNDQGIFHKTDVPALADTEGWWNVIQTADFDGDGDNDFLIGNLGLNLKYKATKDEPFEVFVNDFDGNGTHDVYLGYHDKDGVCYPVRGRQCSSQQMPFIKEKFETYDAFAKAPIDKILEGKLENAQHYVVRKFEHVYLENRGNLDFQITNLPLATQLSPVYGIITHDWNGDGFLDALMVGNFYQREVETTRSDAGTGVVLLGDGSGQFKAMRAESGLAADKDARDVVLMKRKDKNPLIVVANNNDAFQQFEMIP